MDAAAENVSTFSSALADLLFWWKGFMFLVCHVIMVAGCLQSTGSRAALPTASCGSSGSLTLRVSSRKNTTEHQCKRGGEDHCTAALDRAT